MASTTIYLVLGTVDYEGSWTLRAHVSKADAEAFKDKCYEHHKKKPQAPSVIEDTPENDALFDAWNKKHGRWQKRHPAGSGYAWCEGFEVHETKLFEATASKGQP